jgi:hypothetical protein
MSMKRNFDSGESAGLEPGGVEPPAERLVAIHVAIHMVIHIVIHVAIHAAIHARAETQVIAFTSYPPPGTEVTLFTNA